MRHRLFLILMLFTAVSAAANDNFIIDSLRAELKRTSDPTDSIKILYDIFDLSPRQECREIAGEIFMTAGHIKNYDVQLDAIRQIANISINNDSVLRSLQPMLKDIPSSDDKRETEVFINLTQVRGLSRFASEAERIKRIHQIKDMLRNDEVGDVYDRIEKLGTVCILLGNSTHGVAYREYMNQSWELIGQLPSKSNALKNLYLTQRAFINHNLGRQEDAIKADKELIRVTEELADEYHRKGRRFKNFDGILYTSYRRLLSNYDKLGRNETDSIYNRIKELAETNPMIKADNDSTRLSEAYYLMSKERYAEAVPLLINASERLTDRYYQRRILRRLIKASREAGDETALLHALESYNKLLDEYIEAEANANYRELEIVYDVNSLKDINRQSELVYHRTIITISLVILVLLVVFSIVLIILLRRYRRQSVSLEKANRSLKAESSNLQKAQADLIKARDKARIAERHKTQFINNMSHEVRVPLDAITEYSQLIVDCADPGKKKYLERYADIVKLNTELLNTLVNDVLDIGLIENSQLAVRPEPTSLNNICIMAVGAIKPRLAPGVKLEFVKENAPDQLIVTDRKRVEQVLINLLSNAAKFTEEGKITLDYEIERNQNRVVFSVTDTGIGIPEGKEKVIFERFEKIDKHSQGSGLGLSVCALVTRLLKGEIYAEPNRKSGARFIFAIPLS